MVRYYHGFLVYTNVAKERHQTRMYREDVNQVTAESFLKEAHGLSQKVMNEDGFRNKLWTVSAPICAIQYINEEKYLPEDTTVEAERLNKLR